MAFMGMQSTVTGMNQFLTWRLLEIHIAHVEFGFGLFQPPNSIERYLTCFTVIHVVCS
jgi:hypothetical protein